MSDKVYSICIKALQHLYQQISILDRRGENTDDFAQVYEATYIILKSKIDVSRKDINNVDIENNEYLYYHSIRAMELFVLFENNGLIKFGKKEMIPFKGLFRMFFETIKKHTKKTAWEILDDTSKYENEAYDKPADFFTKMAVNVNIDIE
jgi:hypothetical protein